MFHSHRIKGKFIPLQDWVVLRPIKEKERFRDGVLLPDRVEDYGHCEVMAIGPGIVTPHGVRVPCDLKVGEFVYIQKFVEGEMKFNLNGDEVYAIRGRHINVTIDAPTQKPKQRKAK